MTRREVRSTPLKYEDETRSEARRLKHGIDKQTSESHSNSIAFNLSTN